MRPAGNHIGPRGHWIDCCLYSGGHVEPFEGSKRGGPGYDSCFTETLALVLMRERLGNRSKQGFNRLSQELKRDDCGME